MGKRADGIVKAMLEHSRGSSGERRMVDLSTHSPTIVWWMLCLLASCAAVSSPRSASRATFALKSTEYRFRLPVIQVHPSQEQTELNLLSDFPGPPQMHPS